MKNILEIVSAKLGGKGIDKRFPLLVWLFKGVFALTQSDKPIMVATGYGGRISVSARDSGLGLVLRTGKPYEPLLTRLITENVKRGESFLDVGANIGYFSVLASRLVGNKGRVVSVEPSCQSVPYLVKNTKRLKNTLVLQEALSDSVELRNFGLDSGNPGESGFGVSGGNLLSTTTLDDMAKRVRTRKISHLKIDVEGAEVLVIMGGVDFLRKQTSWKMYCECNPKALARLGFEASDLVSAMKRVGLKLTKIIDERRGVVTPYTQAKLKVVLHNTEYVTLVGERYAK